MKRPTPLLAGLLLLGIATLLLLSCATTTSTPKKPTEGGGGTFNWVLNDLAVAKNMAKRENKLILADFWADW